MNICSICNSAPATVNLSSFDISEYCSPCRYKQDVVRALRRATRRKSKSTYYPCS